jgi:hypothetical protein
VLVWKPLAHSVVLYLGVALLCLIYTVCFALFLSGSVDIGALPGGGEPGFGSIEAVRALFMSDGGVVIGWTHYLAFDLFTGLWIARDADAKGFRGCTGAISGGDVHGRADRPAQLADGA